MECHSKFLLFILFFIYQFAFSQEELLNLLSLDSNQTQSKELVTATWKSIRLANTQTTETIKKNHLEYRILHRFGNITNSQTSFNQIAHTAFGLDNASDIRIAFDYGILDNLSVGIGRSRMKEMIDLSVKYALLRQTKDFKVPISISLLSSLGYSAMNTNRLYSEVQNKDFKTRESHRINYFNQLLIASKFTNKLSLQLMPTWFHRNFIVQKQNPNNQKWDSNNYFILGGAFRFKFTDRMAIIADYYYNFHPFYRNHPELKNPLAIGYEVETGGHIFTLFFANNSAILENNFYTTTTDSWAKRQLKFSFCLSRNFSFDRKMKKSS